MRRVGLNPTPTVKVRTEKAEFAVCPVCAEHFFVFALWLCGGSPLWRENMRNKNVIMLVKLGLLTALSMVLALVPIPIFPAAPFLKLDFADVPILIASFMFGPWAGVVVTAVVSLLQGLLIEAASGWVGITMHFFATSLFALTAGCCYRCFHTRRGAVKALIAGSASMIGAMILLNAVLSPVYVMMFMNVTDYAEARHIYMKEFFVWSMLFNPIKAVSVSLITFVVYKAVGRVLGLIKM